MGLRTYWSKRRFSDTPEPHGRPKKKTSRQLEFVVHKHDASHLHYDFRLELDGVLKSWAVPKGPSMNPRVRRLAVAVEDHPFAYRKFEGTIPAGNYGAGQVIIWDNGHYEASEGGIEQLRAGFKKGHLAITMHGHKLRGRFDLVRETDSKNWLLIKKKDDFATTNDVTDQAESVVSGKSITDDTDSLAGFPSSTPPEHVKPMLATLVDDAFDDDGWLFELKFDGYRALGGRRRHELQLYSRSGQDFRQKYDTIAEALEDLPDDTIVDGEIVAVDKHGKPHFNWLQNWQSHSEGELHYYIFDLLWLKGKDIRGLALQQRKELLKMLLPSIGPLRYADHVSGQGRALFTKVTKLGLEGIVAKQADSHYNVGERGEKWLKIKTSLRQEVVIGGFTEPKGSRQYLGSLLLGVYENGKLRYVGHSGGGMTHDELKMLRRRLEKLERQTSPFASQPKPNGPVHWVSPKQLCEVSFSEWTPDGLMRHPKYLGLRRDKPAEKVVAEKPQALSMAKPAIKLTNTDKIFWPELKLSKGDLLHYYEQVQERMLPFLLNHPQVMLRHPNGYKGSSFFQKDLEHPPAGISTAPLFSESTNQTIDYLVCTGWESLLYMVQLGCIEINPWHATVSAIDKPCWVVMDLDPVDVNFGDVVQVAQTIRQLCEEWEIPAYPKTSGKKGLHVYIPTKQRYNESQIKQFAELMAIHINQRQPKLTSLERSPAKRKGKVYLDYLRNATGQTLAAPYSVRPTASASVSMPLAWDEVTPRLQPTDYTIPTIKRRLRQADPWKDFFKHSVDLRRVIDKLSAEAKATTPTG
jgi:bifunctional non-homologous end joining protein LigD